MCGISGTPPPRTIILLNCARASLNPGPITGRIRDPSGARADNRARADKRRSRARPGANWVDLFFRLPSRQMHISPSPLYAISRLLARAKSRLFRIRRKFGLSRIISSAPTRPSLYAEDDAQSRSRGILKDPRMCSLSYPLDEDFQNSTTWPADIWRRVSFLCGT